MTQISPLEAQAGRSARLGQNHGYRIAGDLACLNAEFAIKRSGDQAAKQWALQLWACDRPYVGGELSGIKVAETLLDVPQANTQSPDQPQYCYAETFARLPTGDREYAMVLVLASRSANAREESQEVHDFANYPAREHFQVPGLRGAVDLQPSADKQSVTLHVERIENPREPENLSGSLSLELWALDTAYTGGQFAGQPLAGVELGRLGGQQALEQVTHTLVLTPAAAAHLAAGVTLMLREWTATGYVTRDYRGLSGRAVAPAKSASQPAPASALKAVPTPAVNAASDAVKVATSPAPVSVAPSAAKVASPAAAVNGSHAVNGHSAVAAAATHGTPIAAKGASAVAAVKSAVASALQSSSKSDVPVAATKQPEAATKAVPEDLTTGLVSIQHATLEQLSEVPGLNHKLASEIIKARPFRSLDELARVRGIGDASYRRLRTLLSL